jgi:hypothetical protein
MCRKYVPADKQHAQWDNTIFKTLSDANAKAADAKHWVRQRNQSFNVIHNTLRFVSDPLRPYLLHTLQIRMLPHIQE